MKTRFVFALSGFLSLSLALSFVEAVSAQERRSSSPTRLPVSGYVGTLLGSSELGVAGEANQVLNRFFEFMNEECTRVATAEPDELDQENRWLKAILWPLQDRYWELEDWEGSLIENGQFAAAQRVGRQLADLEFALAAVGVIAEVVGECIDERRRELEAEEEQEEQPAEEPAEVETEPGIYKEGFLTWTASCEAADGIDPPFRGMIQFTLGDGAVHGLLMPADANVLLSSYLEIARLNPDGSFRLATPPEAVNRVEILAPATSDPPARSGTIRMSGVLEGYGSWSCTGTWTGQ